MNKKELHNGRRHGARAKTLGVARLIKTVLTFESRAQVYCWTVDRGRRTVIKH